MDLNELVHDISTKLEVEISDVSGLMDGQSHQIYQLKYPRGEVWSLRIPKTEAAASIGKRGMSVLNHLKKVQPALQVPKPIYQSNEYALLSFLDGDTLGAWDSAKLPEKRRHQLLNSLAAFLFELWLSPAPQSGKKLMKTKFYVIQVFANLATNQVCSKSYREWLRDEIDKAFLRSLPESSGWGDPLTFLYRRANMESVIAVGNCVKVAVRHGDLNAWNIIVDEEGISGVIDWDTAQYVPMPAAVHHPLFIADIPGWSNDIPEGMTFQEDRAYLEVMLHKLATERRDSNGLWIADLLKTSCERQFFELSLRNKRINICYIDMRIENTMVDKAVVKEQLDALLSISPKFRGHPDILKLYLRLDGGGSVLLNS
ncbi:hypothetical protein QQS21_004877 [Conoideocrella luteorostrata]|uniref:Aminoglycoside phosphotransferase domain-containing protein n=1 Tax=Conoideocrella luteorostrata TaxID=1105319 RepID=A0AAJ0FV12_9HYPO|nr:hypothetical protein QQS21_004877 [Conoideocrella luteorostrata]